ncbi:50S ribosomal protein L13 [Candidatus Wolfebacteria bacterium]|nr:50S ribosomal protein L13 [Candidatus Wolfebacteria bacterium]
MTTDITKTYTHEIDASGKVLGRLAGEIATILRGKDTPAFVRHQAPDVSVKVTNASGLLLTSKKRLGTTYNRHSHHPGGFKRETMEHVIATKGYGELIRRAVYGMLPDNKLRKDMMQRLRIEE